MTHFKLSFISFSFLVLLFGCDQKQEVTYDIVISNARVVDPETGFDKVSNIGILGKKLPLLHQRK